MADRAREDALQEEFATLQFIYGEDDSRVKDLSLSLGDQLLRFQVHLNAGAIHHYKLDVTNFPDNFLMFDANDDVVPAAGSLIEILQIAVAHAEGQESKSLNKSSSKEFVEEIIKISDDTMDYESYGTNIEAGNEADKSDDYEYNEADYYSDENGDLDSYDEALFVSDDSLQFSQEIADENRYKRNSALMRDIRNFEVVYGSDAISARPMPSLEVVDIILALPPLDMLDATTAQAWGVRLDSPLYVAIQVSDLYYLDGSKEPGVEIYQLEGGKKSKFGLQAQLIGLLRQFLSYHWPHKSGTKINSLALTMDDISKFRVAAVANSPRSGIVGNYLGKVFGRKTKDVIFKMTLEMKDAVESMIDMGFESALAFNALTHVRRYLETNFDVPMATDLLLNTPELAKRPADSFVKNEREALRKSRGDKKTAPRVDSLFNEPHKALKSLSENEKMQVSSKYGLFVMIAAYISRRIGSLNDYCVICDKPHVFATGNMLKPAVCSRELCVWSFQQLGVGADAAQEIATEAEVVDLLVSMATAAIKSPRNAVIFDPYPSVFDPRDGKSMIFDPNRKNFGHVIQVLTKMPSVEQMTNAQDFHHLKSAMDAVDPLCFPLLQWIISSNRSHIVLLPPDRLVKSMGTRHQYLLLSAPPEKENIFRELKEKHGSTYAFHGSSVENWHSILRKGLVNASGTRLQVNGAAYGSGIYLSPSAATSFGYSRMVGGGRQNQGNRFLNSDTLNCIALCEVIDKDIRKSGDIWVQPNEDYVVTRFFFVYTDMNIGQAQSNHTQSNSVFVQEVENAVGAYNNI